MCFGCGIQILCGLFRIDDVLLRSGGSIYSLNRSACFRCQVDGENQSQWQCEDDMPISHDADTLRLSIRLRKHWDSLFTFLAKPEVPFDNNLAETSIRPAAILRMNSQSIRSEQGAATRDVLMRAYRTLRLHGLDPTKTITTALQIDLQTGNRPPLSGQVAAGG